MKRKLSNLLRKSGLAALILAGALALSAPATVLAQRGGGGHGFSGGGHSYGGGQHFSAPRGGAFRGGGGDYRGGGGGYRGGGGYYRPGFGFGFGYGYAAPYYGYGYAAPVAPCGPGGYYDRWGRWIPNAGCYVA